jgi:DNA mismatch endonuclease (patch repair protein)
MLADKPVAGRSGGFRLDSGRLAPYRCVFPLPGEALPLDRFDPLTRSEMMSRIRGRDTKPEMLLRRSLHALGLRYRLHDRKLPGTPDLVFPRYHAVVFVHGCFWHAHGCRNSKIPETRREFWERKLAANRERDRQVMERLGSDGWRVLVVWECALRRRPDDATAEIVRRTAAWLQGTDVRGEIERADATDIGT